MGSEMIIVGEIQKTGYIMSVRYVYSQTAKRYNVPKIEVGYEREQDEDCWDA